MTDGDQITTRSYEQNDWLATANSILFIKKCLVSNSIFTAGNRFASHLLFFTII